MDYNIKIGATAATVADIPQPASVDFLYSDIDGDSYRNAKGTLVRDYIATKLKLTCKWNALTDVEMSKLLKAVYYDSSNKHMDSFYVQCHNPMTNTTSTFKAYVGDRTASVYSFVERFIRYSSLTMDFIQY